MPTLKKHFQIKHKLSNEIINLQKFRIEESDQSKTMRLEHQDHIDILKNGFLYEYNVII